MEICFIYILIRFTEDTYKFHKMARTSALSVKVNSSYKVKSLTASNFLHRLVLSIEVGTVQTGTGKWTRPGNSSIHWLPVYRPEKDNLPCPFLVQYKLRAERLTQLGNSSVLRLPVMGIIWRTVQFCFSQSVFVMYRQFQGSAIQFQGSAIQFQGSAIQFQGAPIFQMF